jgi:D-inositol-3-phosphate glycosyltransferase
MIMPSRHEGFGLAAYEAIAAGVPVLVSQDSGLARLLMEKVPNGEQAIPREILPVRGDSTANAEIWGQALYETLSDPSAFRGLRP